MSYLLRALGLFFLIYAGKPVLETVIGLIQTRLQYPIGLTTGINVILFAGGVGLLMLREWARKALKYACIGLIIKSAIEVAQPIISLKVSWNILIPLIQYGIFTAVLSMPQAEASTIE